MQTQVMHEPAVGLPWLEFSPTDGGPPEQVVLDALPFSIGRNETANLPLQSTRVSREHAVIVREGEVYRVKDLGSTNGTFLNGQRVHEAPLSDGDILLVADVEFSFFCGHSRGARGSATQVMSTPARANPGDDPAIEMIGETRRLHETVAHCAVESLFQPVVDLATGKILGYEAITEEDRGLRRTAAAQAVLALDCRLTARLRYLRRMVAVEEAAGLPGELRIFVGLHPSEIGAAGLVETLGRLRGLMAPGQGLVVGLPESAVPDSPYVVRLRQQLRGLGIGIRQAGAAGSDSETGRTADGRPDYIQVPASLVAGIDRTVQRKRQAEAIVSAARRLACEVIALGIQAQPEAEACRAVGCRYGQGAYFGGPKPLQSWLGTGSRATGT